MSQRAFYLLRRTLMEHVGAAREAIGPNAELRGVISADRTTQVWPALEKALQTRVWPPLIRPPLLAATLYILTCAVFVCVFVLAVPTGIAEAAGIGLGATLVFGIIAILATKRWRTRIPGELQQIRDLVPYAGTSDQIAWTRDKVALVVKMLTLEQLGLSESDYHEDAHCIDDLGLS